MHREKTDQKNRLGVSLPGADWWECGAPCYEDTRERREQSIVAPAPAFRRPFHYQKDPGKKTLYRSAEGWRSWCPDSPGLVPWRNALFHFQRHRQQRAQPSKLGSSGWMAPNRYESGRVG